MRSWYALVFVTSLLVINACGETGMPNVKGTILTSIVVTPARSSIPAGASQQFTATGMYSDNSTQNLTDSVTWTSSDTSRANITNAGLATAVAEGTITITASLGRVNGSATLDISAQHAALLSIIVLPRYSSIAAASKQQFTAIGIYSDTTTQNITGSVIWSSFPATIAAVSAGGLVTGFTPGTATITATSGSVYGNTTLAVSTAILQSISVTPVTQIIAAGTPMQFAAVGTYSDGTIQTITSTVTWSSSTPGAATISSGGLATGIAAGTTTIMATSGEVSGSSELTVTDAVLLHIAVTPGEPTIAAGSSAQLTANGIYSDGTVKNITSLSSWSTSSAGVATVSAAGLATGVAAGSATIMATTGAISGSTTVTITPAGVQPVPAKAQWAHVDRTADGTYSSYYSVATSTDGSVYAAGYLWLSPATTHDFGNGVTTTGTATGDTSVLTKYDSAGNAQWAKTPVAGTAGFSGVTVAPDGSVFAVGSTYGTGTVDFGNGITAAVSGNSSDALVVKYNSSGAAQWASTVTGGTSYSGFRGVSAAADGSVYAAGIITGKGTFDFGNGATATGLVAFPGQSIILVKYNSTGTAQWARTMVAGTGESVFNGVTVAPDGSVYAAGYMVGAGTYDLGNSVTAAGSLDGRNSLLVKYDSTGKALWCRTMQSTPGTTDIVSKVAFNGVSAASDGSIYAAGSIASIGIFDFGNNVTVTGTSARGNDAVILVKYDPSGTARWARTVASGDAFDYSMFYSVSAAPDGYVYAAGYMSGIGTFDFGDAATTIGTYYDRIILVKYSGSGTTQWVNTMVPGTNHSWCYGVSAASDGSVYTAGWIYGTGTFDFGNNVTTTGNWVENFLLVKYQ